jgi:hypothetical protein
VLGQPVDSSSVAMRGTNSIVELVDIYCLVEIRQQNLPTKEQAF